MFALLSILLLATLPVAAVASMFMLVGLSMHLGRASLPHLPDHICLDLTATLRDHPDQWSLVTHNPPELAEYPAFAYTMRHTSGCTLWIANGWSSFHVYEPHKMFIPLRYKLPMWRYYRKNKNRMRWTCIDVLVDQLFQSL